MKRTTLGTWQMVIDKCTTTGTAFLVYLRTTNELWLSDTSSLNETASVDSTPAAALLDTSSFHHYVVTKSGATRQWYVDGVAVTTGGSNQTFGNSTNSLTIGYSPSHTSDKLSATLDEVALYSTALSAARVMAHYEAHRAYLQDRKAKGVLVASGPLEPRYGGALLLKERSLYEAVRDYRQENYHAAHRFTSLGRLLYGLAAWSAFREPLAGLVDYLEGDTNLLFRFSEYYYGKSGPSLPHNVTERPPRPAADRRGPST